MDRLYIFGNKLHLAVLWVIAAITLIEQFYLADLPCPLCMFQRIAMILAALGPFYLLCTATRRPFTAQDVGVGAGITILASLLGGAVAIRQILLHILPWQAGYGPPLLGYHLYTWALVIFTCNILAASLQLMGLAWFEKGQQIARREVNIMGLAIGLIIIINILGVIAECGFAWELPPNPITYLLFK
jgi:disulfide bond formation protein DsbB